MRLKSYIIVLVVQVETLGKETILVDVIHPSTVSQALGQSQLRCDDSIFLEVVDELPVIDIFIVYFSALQGELEVEAGAVNVWILNPSAFA